VSEFVDIYDTNWYHNRQKRGGFKAKLGEVGLGRRSGKKRVETGCFSGRYSMAESAAIAWENGMFLKLTTTADCFG